MVVGQVSFYAAIVCEFERVLDQVEQHLLQTCLISVQSGHFDLYIIIISAYRTAMDTLVVA